ncbi:UNVERIFIED_CONTAM: hypothetical protein Sangu_3027700 [Sesamum angustifolium]|uniref:DDE Tnp4 domain-containing protein n=1 Tax=Sesamum angustifolium TaxID=2727405 RepID=A0AAW2KM71_9LAMI
MRHHRRILALLAVQQVVVEISVALTIFVEVFNILKIEDGQNVEIYAADTTSILGYPINLDTCIEQPRGIKASKNVSVAEQVAMFLSIISHHKKNCVVKHEFIRSGRTMSKNFHFVLLVVCKMHSVLLAKPTPINDDCQDPHWRCVRLNLSLTHEYRSMKKEGSAADNRVLWDVIHKPGGLRVPAGNYYLYDNGYANAEGFLTPYRGVWYLLREWDRGAGGPQNKEELFNLKHSSARNVIEKTFGLLKVHWGILRSQSFYLIDVQSKIIITYCLLHNFIRNEMPDDPLELELPEDHDLGFETNADCVSTIESNSASSAWRDSLASSMYNDWLRHS